MSVYTIELDDYSDADRRTILETVFCNTRFWPGDHLEAASPAEASFWPIHPTIDRLLQYKERVFPFMETVWDGESICTTSGTNDGCKGHNAYDLTFWATVTKIDGVYQKTHLTNQEVRDAVRPSNYSMPYIYDHFDWPHCHSQGITFPSPI